MYYLSLKSNCVSGNLVGDWGKADMKSSGKA